MALSSEWRIGFEVEVVLDDLMRPDLFPQSEGPMDMASHRYCKEVASCLRFHTGLKWSAPRTKKFKPGFYVLPEYGLDPLEWPEGLIAGVELLTPPVPIDEAEEIRGIIARAIEALDGLFNFETGTRTSEFGWHINVDAGNHRLDPARFMIGAREMEALFSSYRYPSPYAAPQRHAFGVPLLKHLHADPAAKLVQNPYWQNFLSAHRGEGKQYAANFGKLSSGYLELRHYSTPLFLQDVPLRTLLNPLLLPFQMDHETAERLMERQIHVFQLLQSWLVELKPRLSHRWGPRTGIACVENGHIYLDEEPVAQTLWNGDLTITLLGNRRWSAPAVIPRIPLEGMFDGLALLALDVAESRETNGRGGLPVGSPTFRREITDLRRRLAKAPPFQFTEMGLAPWWRL